MKLNIKKVLNLTAGLILGWPLAAEEVPFLALQYLAQPQVSGPCLASLVGPPSVREHCIPWVANVDAAPTYEPARRLIFTGAGDNFLHLIDADTGRLFGRIPTLGRVITKVVFSADGTKMYFGTDQGLVAAHDAFSFKKLWTFQADSRINNDLMVYQPAALASERQINAASLIFSSGLSTVYRLNLGTGKEVWQLDRPLNANRLKLATYSNIILLKNEHSLEGGNLLAAPHPDGYISIIDLESGSIANQVRLRDGLRERAFPDIVAPMLYFGGLMWVASYDLGVFIVDPASGQVRNRINVLEVQRLVFDGERVYAATNKQLIAISMAGGIIWKNNFGGLKTREARYGYPFAHFSSIPKRVFNGLPSQLIRSGDGLIMATSLGAMAVFNAQNGELRQVVGNSLGFGPKIYSLAKDGVLAVTERGLLAKFKFKKLRKGGN